MGTFYTKHSIKNATFAHIAKCGQKWAVKFEICEQCQQSRISPPLTPVHKWESPRIPWPRMHIDPRT
ncbi:hypothetical protein T12_13866 [Trichinella patagoniensis]|uniref:Integrase zinc-binding domain-containing protein n=1 Tax=Trichinella patagoniensis TaxID=990121 RepID=A0A0V0Z314_9BILA|nr:hypothetical protein T12_13866 [Trichinella patagoniensis]